MLRLFSQGDDGSSEAVAFLEQFQPHGVWVLAALGGRSPLVASFPRTLRDEARLWLSKRMRDKRSILVLTAEAGLMLHRPPLLADLAQSRYVGVELLPGRALDAGVPQPFLMVRTPQGFAFLWRFLKPLRPAHAQHVEEALATRLNGQRLKFFLPLPGTGREATQIKLLAMHKDRFCVPTDLHQSIAPPQAPKEQDDPDMDTPKALAEIDERPVDWVWPQVIAAGKLNLLGGPPGHGKSQVTIDMAAILSRGGEWPCQGGTAKKGAVLLLAGEDNPEDTIKPRIVAAGGDPARCFVDQHPYNLHEELDRLKAKAGAIPDLRLIILDPITAYYPAGGKVRRTLSALIRWAEANDIAVVGILHTLKGQKTATATDFFASSAEFSRIARLGWMVFPAENEKKLLLFAKGNIVGDKRGWVYTLQSVILPSGIETSRVVWDDERVAMTGDDFLAAGPKATSIAAAQPQPVKTERAGKEGASAVRRQVRQGSARTQAAEWLKTILADGPLSGRDVKAKAEAAGIPPATLYRAARTIPVTIDGSGFGQPRMWSLTDSQRTPSGSNQDEA